MKYKRLFSLIIFALGSLLLVSCAGRTSSTTQSTTSGPSSETSTSVEIVSIVVDAETYLEEYFLDDFDLGSIKIIVNYSNGSSEKISLSSVMLSTLDLQKLSTVGVHQIVISYQNFTTELSLTLTYPEIKMKMYLVYQLAVQAEVTELTFEEWLESIRGEDGVSIVDCVIAGDGHLIIFLSDGQEIDVGLIMGSPGKQIVLRIGPNNHLQWQYEDEVFWQNLFDLSELHGENGLGIKNVFINDFGELIITYSDDNEDNLGSIYKTYLVMFKGMGGVVLDVQMVFKNHPAIAPLVPEIEGYDFISWDSNFDEITGDHVINAIYSLKSYTISFVTDGFDPIDDIEGVLHNTSRTLPTPEKAGYVFLGWYLGFEANAAQVTNQTLITSDLVLYSRWVLADYIVTFLDYDHTVLKVDYVRYNSSATPPAQPIRMGYLFNAWDQDFTFVTENMDVYATYSLAYYTLFLESNGGQSLPSYVGLTYGQIVELPVPSRDDYDFLHWTYQGEPVGTHFTMPANDAMLVAQWIPHLYSISFETNGGSVFSDMSVER